MRSRLFSIAVLVSCGVLLIWHHAPPALRPDPEAGNQHVIDKLSQRDHYAIDGLPLAEALERLAKRGNVPIEIDRQIDATLQPSLQQPVGLPLYELRLESALRLLLRQANPNLALAVKEGRVLVTQQKTLDQSTRLYVGQIYPIPVGAVGELGLISETLCDVIESTLSPVSWEDVGGPGATRALPGAIAVSQTALRQQKIKRLVEALVVAERYPDRNTPIRISPSSSNTFARWHETLNSKISLDVDNLTFGEIMEQLRVDHGLPIYYDRVAMDENGQDPDDPDWRLTFQLHDVRVATVLHWVAKQFSLVAIDQHDTIFLTTPDYALGLTETIVYPVGDLIEPEGDMDTLLDAMAAVIQPDTWDDVGGDGGLYSCGRALVVTQSAEIQAEVADFLQRLRRVVIGGEFHPVSAERSPVPEVIKQLEKRVSLDVRERPLGEVVEQLCTSHNLNLLIDHVAFDEMNVWDNWQSNVTFQATDQPLSEVFGELLSTHSAMILPWKDVVLATSLNTGCSWPTLELYDIGPLLPPNERSHYDDQYSSHDDVVDLITSLVSPSSWDDVGGDCSLSVVQNALVVLQIEQDQALLRSLIADLMLIPDLPDEFGICTSSPLKLSNTPCAYFEHGSNLNTQIYQLGPTAQGLFSRSRQRVNEANVALKPFIKEQCRILRRWQAIQDDNAIDAGWFEWDSDYGEAVCGTLTVEGRSVFIVHQTEDGHKTIEPLLRAVAGAYSNAANTKENERGWHSLPLDDTEAKDRKLFLRDVNRELEWLTQFGRHSQQEPYVAPHPALMLLTFLIENLPQPYDRQTYVWNNQVLVIVDDASETERARHAVDSLLTSLSRVHSQMMAAVGTHATLDPQTDTLLDILLEDNDPLRRQCAVLLLGARTATRQPLTAAQVKRFTQWSFSSQRPLEWQTFMLAATASSSHGNVLIDAMEAKLPRLSRAQTDDLLWLLGRLGPRAVPLLCRIPTRDNNQRRLRESSLSQAIKGNAQVISAILEMLSESDDDDQLYPMLSVIGDGDPEFKTTRQVLNGPPPASGEGAAERWRHLQEQFERYVGDLFP